MKPTFLCIGAQKAGTTWLDAALRSADDVAMPRSRKEVHFFDTYYHRGVDWYEGFFPRESSLTRSMAIGEVTPSYLFDPDVPARIREVLPDVKLIVLLRNPVDRLESHFRMDWSRGSVNSEKEFLDQKSEPFQRGLYSEQLSRYQRLFSAEDILILIFEEVFFDACSRARAMGRVLLHIGSSGNPDLAIADGNRNSIVSSGRVSQFRLYRAATRTAAWLRRHDLDLLVNLGKNLGLGEKSFGVRRIKPPRFCSQFRNELLVQYEPDIQRLEGLLGRDLDVWRQSTLRTSVAAA